MLNWKHFSLIDTVIFSVYSNLQFKSVFPKQTFSILVWLGSLQPRTIDVLFEAEMNKKQMSHKHMTWMTAYPVAGD